MPFKISLDELKTVQKEFVEWAHKKAQENSLSSVQQIFVMRALINIYSMPAEDLIKNQNETRSCLRSLCILMGKDYSMYIDKTYFDIRRTVKGIFNDEKDN